MALMAFLISVGIVINWYLAFPDVPIIECNETLFLGLLEQGHSVVMSERLACRQVGVIDRPTGYTTLVSVLVGASAGVFGFYASTGRKWGNEAISSIRNSSSTNGSNNIPPVQPGSETIGRTGNEPASRNRTNYDP
jgi:hypothetical protein